MKTGMNFQVVLHLQIFFFFCVVGGPFFDRRLPSMSVLSRLRNPLSPGRRMMIEVTWLFFLFFLHPLVLIESFVSR